MVVWRITGDEIGPNGNGAAHFETKKKAESAWLEYLEWCEDKGKQPMGEGPQKLEIKNRLQLAMLLDEAMGFGVT